MKEFVLKIKDVGVPEIQVKDGKIKKKGFIDPRDCIKVLDDVKRVFQHKLTDQEVRWNIPTPNTLAIDNETNSIIVVLPADTYYIPYVAGKEPIVFQCKLPPVICIKKTTNIYLFYTDDDDNITIESNIYPLKIGHVYGDGHVCLGSFDQRIDLNNAREYFRELICYPASHAHEVKYLREIQEQGFKKTFQNKKKMSSFI
ncbi:hypothetical protein KHQ81_12950 [Mycoplasmatota bacterium]|nr:hypothetical protein KHQ81_12950 [Mycoplasmatota bacterium]